MATNAPNTRCLICGQPHEYEVVPRHRLPGSPLVFGTTEWQMKPHHCPPDAVQAWVDAALSTTERPPE